MVMKSICGIVFSSDCCTNLINKINVLLNDLGCFNFVVFTRQKKRKKVERLLGELKKDNCYYNFWVVTDFKLIELFGELINIVKV